MWYHFSSWTNYEFMGIAMWQIAAAFVSILAGMVLKKISDFIFDKKVIPLLKKTPWEFDNLMASAASRPAGWLFLLGGFAGAFSVLPLPTNPNVGGFVFGALKILLAVDIVWFLYRCIDVLVDYLTAMAQRTESKLDDQLIPLIRKALKLTIGAIGFVWVVQLLGYSVSSLVAGLGIGGLAIALALKDTLANFFGSIVIFLDRPFAVGDRIKLSGVDGTVEGIGFRSTRIRTLGATIVSLPNSTVANTTIDNLSKRPKRRIVQTVGVTYDANADQMERAVGAIRNILESNDGVDQEYIVVRFTDFGDSSLDISMYYFTKSVSFGEHAEVREQVNLAIMRMLEGMGLSIAFPSRTVYFGNAMPKEQA